MSVAHSSNTLLWLVDLVHEGYIDQSDSSIDELASTTCRVKAWPGDLPVGMLGDLQAMFSSITGRGEFTLHIWILGLSEVCTHKHSQDNINVGNDDKIVYVDNIVKSENATENNVEVEELFEDDKS